MSEWLPSHIMVLQEYSIWNPDATVIRSEPNLTCTEFRVDMKMGGIVEPQ